MDIFIWNNVTDTSRPWIYIDLAFDKGKTLLDHGAVFSEFGTRRRRSYHTQDLVMKGLIRADKEKSPDGSGKLTGTSNVHFAHRYIFRLPLL